MIKRYYVRGSVVPFEEDATHEFKGHKNLCAEEIPPWTVIDNSDRRTRAPVSRVLNGFLNTGTGGTVYLGIIDNGTVKGINLTQYKKDHFTAQLDDLFNRYHPPVEEHRYKVKFVPVVDKNLSDDDILRVATFDTSSTAISEERRRPHLLRTYKYCWCDKEAVSRYNSGIMATDYVIEITLKPWDPDDTRNHHAIGQMKAHPVHEDETGRSYFRRQGCVVQYNTQELHLYSQKLVDDHYGPEIQKLKRQLQELRSGAV